MNRRGFLKLFGMAVAGVAIDQAIPLGRVWSFPSKIVVPTGEIIPLAFSLPIEFSRLAELSRMDFMLYDAFKTDGITKVSSRPFRIPMRIAE